MNVSEGEANAQALELATFEVFRMFGFLLLGALCSLIPAIAIVASVIDGSFKLESMIFFFVLFLGCLIFYHGFAASIGWLLIGSVKVMAVPRLIRPGVTVPISIEFISYDTSNIRQLNIEFYYLNVAAGASKEYELAKTIDNVQKVGDHYFCSVDISPDAPIGDVASKCKNFLRVNFRTRWMGFDRVFRFQFKDITPRAE